MSQEHGVEGGPTIVRRAVDTSLVMGIVLAIITTLLYVLSPIDAVPDLVPVLGQLDDMVAILLGGGSVSVLAALRVLIGAGVHNPAARKACLSLLLIVVVPVVMGIACVAAATAAATAGLLANR
jgi:hypothetical protein